MLTCMCMINEYMHVYVNHSSYVICIRITGFGVARGGESVSVLQISSPAKM